MKSADVQYVIHTHSIIAHVHHNGKMLTAHAHATQPKFLHVMSQLSGYEYVYQKKVNIKIRRFLFFKAFLKISDCKERIDD